MAVEGLDLTKGLLDFIDDEEIKELDISPDEGSKISSSNQANYYIKKSKEVQEQKKKIIETCKEQLDRYKSKVDAWEERMLSGLNNEEEYYESLLKSYALEQLEGSSKRSMSLVEGTISFRASQPLYKYEDDKAIECLEKTDFPYVRNDATIQFSNTDAAFQITDDELFVDGQKIGEVKLKKSLDKAALKKNVEIKDGKAYIGETLIEGITVEPREDTFTIK